jgi:hypothetical protein
MSTTFNSPQMLKRYSNGELRIVTHKSLSNGDTIIFKNEKFLDESAVITDIKEQRPSMGEFGDQPRPTSYRLAVL